MKYRLMIVDDEESIRNGMANSIPWKEWGYEVCALCENGKEAVELINEVKPHVVLSDIRMPIMDGIALMQWLHQNQPEIKIVILSGYSDFEYLSFSIKNQVTDYLLKPTDLDEFEVLFVRLYHHMEEQRLQKQKIQNSINHHFGDWLRDLATGQSTLEDTERFMPEARRRGVYVDNCILAAFRVDGRAGEEEKSLHQFKIQVVKLWQEMKLPVNFTCMLMNNGMLFGIFSIPEEEVLNEEDVICAARMLQEEIRLKLHTTVSVGLSDLATEAALLPQAWEQAQYCLKQNIFYGKEGLLIYSHLNMDYSDEMVYFSVEVIESSLLDGDYNTMCAEIDRVWDSFRNGPKREYYVVDRLCMSLLFTIALWALRYDIQMGDVLRGLGVTYEDIYHCDTLEKKRDFLCAALFAVQLQLVQRRNQSKRGASLAYQIRELIEREFDDNKMSLEYIANKLQRHPSYVSKMFKKELGCSFNDYLNRLRIEKAEQLLISQRFKVYEIAQKCGYVDTSHFNRVFRKHKGVSPSEYRTDGVSE